MPTKPAGTAQRTATRKPLAFLSEARWSTRRVATISGVTMLIGNNPKTIGAIITWATTTANDWHAAATAAGLL